MKKNTKQIMSIVLFMVTIFTLALTILLGKHILFTVNDEIANSGLSTSQSNASGLAFEDAWASFDYSIMFVIIGLTVGLIISSFLIPTHPIFLAINIIGMFFLVFMGAIFSNMYDDIYHSGGINDTAIQGNNDLGGITFVMQKLPFICAVVVLLSTIVIYSRNSS